MTASPQELHALGERAAALVADGSVVGLGSGKAASAFVAALAARVTGGLRVRGVATSQATCDLAGRLGVPVVSLDDVDGIDLTVDGADEVAPDGGLIKGFGGAMVREKIVAVASRKLVIVVGPEKLVPVLGANRRLPVEVVPFAVGFVRRHLGTLGFPAEQRRHGGRPFVTDNGNTILDLQVPPLTDPHAVEEKIHGLPGVVGTGLFLGLADSVLVSDGRTLTFDKPAV